jgi:hypothetical protein
MYSGFTLVGMLREYSYIKWTRRFNMAGEFILEMLATEDAMRLVKYADTPEGAVLYKGQGGEAAFVEDFVSRRDAFGNGVLEVSGRFLNAALERRVVSLAMTGTLKDVIGAIITQNFTAPANPNRQISEMRLMDYTPSDNPTVSVEIKGANALEEISKLCGRHNIGFKVIFNVTDHTYDFTLYEGRPTSVLLTDGYFNILEQDYYFQARQEKTACLVDLSGTVEIIGDNVAGLARKEMYAQADTQSAAPAQEQGAEALHAAKRVISFDTVVNMETLQFPYGADWDLGDIVACESLKWQKAITQNVLEVTEYDDRGGVHLTPVFGDYIPNAKR